MLDRSTLAFVLLACGCNQIYGLDATIARDAYEGGNGELLIDLDLDGISDDGDPCLAPLRDAMDDLDADGVMAATDLCPFDAATASGDGDMVPDVCDPFPTMPGDRLRCYMSFGSTDLNARIWKSRDPVHPWSSREGEIYGEAPGLGTTSGLVSTLELESGMQPTFESFVSFHNSTTIGPYAFRMWGRAADTHDDAELGCEISGDANSTRLAIVRGNDMDVTGGATTLVGVEFPKSLSVRIRMTFAASGAGFDMRCTFAWPPGIARTVKAFIAERPPGRLAFGVQNGQGNLSALAIYERDTIAPLP